MENVFSREEWSTPDSIQSSIKTKIDCLLTFYIRTTFRNHPNSNCSKRTWFLPLFPHQSIKFTRLTSQWDRTAIVGKKNLQLLQLFYYGGILIFCRSTAKASLVIMFQSIFPWFYIKGQGLLLLAMQLIVLISITACIKSKGKEKGGAMRFLLGKEKIRENFSGTTDVFLQGFVL